MKEIGIINRELARAISEQGHQDMLMIADAGFAIPKGVECIDISLSENKPMVLEVIEELKKYYSVEKMILSNQTKETNPTFFKNVAKIFNNTVEIETLDHSELKEKSKSVKAVIRTGDFTAYGNVILVSGAGDRWYLENNIKN